MATDEVVLHGTIRPDSKIRSQNVQFHGSFWREQTLAAKKLFLSLIRIDFAVLVSSRAVRVFPALSLRHVRPSYGTFSLMVFQGNCARGRTGHMIMGNIGPRSFLYGPRDARSVLSQPRANIPQCGPRPQLVKGYYLRSD